jgi:hypothetical protein
MRLQLLAARWALVLLVLASVTAAAAVAGVRLAMMPFARGLAVMTGATALGLAALAFAIAWLITALRHNRGEGKRAGLIALIGSLFLLTPPLHAAYMDLISPPIHDAATDPEDPPQFVALAKARKPGTNSPVYDGSRQIRFHGESNTANYMLHTYYAEMTHPKGELQPPLNTKPAMFWHAFETVKKLGWTIMDYSEKEGRIEAVDTSLWFGQKADIVIRVEEAGPNGSRLDARSQSETGTRDFGSNIARLEALRGAL